MNCPACGNVMTEMTAGSVKVQACPQSAGEALLNIERNPSATVDPSNRYKCPKNPAVVMMRHFWSVKRDVVVDECPECEGIFLDTGELATIRGDYTTDADRHTAAKAYCGEMFDKEIADIVAKDKTKMASAQRITHLFRFMAPKYYVASKDAWIRDE